MREIKVIEAEIVGGGISANVGGAVVGAIGGAAGYVGNVIGSGEGSLGQFVAVTGGSALAGFFSPVTGLQRFGAGLGTVGASMLAGYGGFYGGMAQGSVSSTIDQAGTNYGQAGTNYGN